MNQRQLRVVWFAALFLMMPWPLSAIGDAFVPAVRFVMLAVAGLAVAVAEGAQGPAPLIIGLMIAAAVVSTALCGGIAFFVARGLHRLGPRTAWIATAVLISLALIGALTTSPYETPFGHAPRGGLLEIFS